MSEVLSMHDHGNCELCDQLESELALLIRAVGFLGPIVFAFFNSPNDPYDERAIGLYKQLPPEVLELIKEQHEPTD